MLRRYRAALADAAPPRLGGLTVVVGAGYFLVWTLLGVAAFPLGVGLAALEMQAPLLSRSVPFAVAGVFVLAGLLQLTAWKARQLACCRDVDSCGRTLAADVGTAWSHGLRLGVRCARCCAGQMAILLCIGVMDLRAMAVVSAAITVERLGPSGERVARSTGAVFVVVGLFQLARAAALA
jgi:predicted metal-binding membrane protein